MYSNDQYFNISVTYCNKHPHDIRITEQESEYTLLPSDVRIMVSFAI